LLSAYGIFEVLDHCATNRCGRWMSTKRLRICSLKSLVVDGRLCCFLTF
jgi:hypothetical protein